MGTVPTDPAPTSVRIEVEPREMDAGGTITCRVLVDGRWVGWVGDGREWRGHRYGGRRWWACWRQEGDTAARWGTDLDYRARAAALNALLVQVADSDAEDGLAQVELNVES